MTGRRADVWRRFKFVTVPAWVYLLLVLFIFAGFGIIVHLVVRHALAQRARGYLPLSRLASRVVTIAVWFPIGIVALAAVVLVVGVAAAANDSSSPIGGKLFLFSIVLLVGGLLVRQLFQSFLFPRAKVNAPMPGYGDRVLEMRHLHPNFVAAVRRRQLERSRGYSDYVHEAGRVVPTQRPFAT